MDGDVDPLRRALLDTGVVNPTLSAPAGAGSPTTQVLEITNTLETFDRVKSETTPHGPEGDGVGR